MNTTCERCWEHVVPIVDGQAAELCVSCELVEARAEIERLRRLVPNPDDLRAVLMLAGYGIPAHALQLRAAGASDASVEDIGDARQKAVARVRATLEGTE